MKSKGSLGTYWDFPSRYHGAAILEFNLPMIEVQKSILNALYRLNGRSIGDYLKTLIGSNINVIFEFGVADGLVFNYIDGEILKSLLDEVKKRTLHNLDVFCIIRYYALGKNGGSRPRALRFDYYFIRFLFRDSEVEVQVFHERGLQRISVEGLLKFLAERIGLEMAKGGDGAVKIKRLWTGLKP
ncbi:MAG: hypothetical protein QW600_00180 [Candidatus Bathyarchaeia archaeon]|nr:hypothetical protein [Candidatus Bathyarchaeota archaeon]